MSLGCVGVRQRMRKWPTTPAFRVVTRQHKNIQLRWFSSQHDIETVAVRCASSGSIDVNLHNVSQHKPSHPLVIYIPPFFQVGRTSTPPLPAFLKSYPSAVINYRWLDPSTAGDPTNGGSQASPFQWPTAIHDTLFGYSWLIKNLCPSGGERRDVYVYGSYLGAGLAASLALTESHADRNMAVRGLLTHNGIYNWTMFFPDHPIHQRKSVDDALKDTSYVEGSFFHYMRDRLSVLFASPSGMFDPFASPSLFFRDPGLWLPEDFNPSVTANATTKAIDVLSSASSSPEEDTQSASSPTSTAWNLKPPPKSYLTFPPSSSTLRIPDSLLLYESPPPPSHVAGTRRRKAAPKTAKKRKILNNFEGQAMELANFMRRSVEKYEFRGREDSESAEVEAERRVQARDVGAVEGDGTLGAMGQDIAHAWLKERIRR